MTVAEVQRAVPTARAVAKPDTSTAGWLTLLHARVREGSRDQQVDFQFQQDRLIGVVVMMGSPHGLAPIDQAGASSIRSGLRAAYGPALRSVYTEEDNFIACMWIREGRFIGYLERPPPTTAVMLFLHVTQPGDGDLLPYGRPAPGVC